MEELCRICEASLNDGRECVKVKLDKAVQNINECDQSRGLSWAGNVTAGDVFHVECRKIFTKRKNIKAVTATNPDSSALPSVKTRSGNTGATMVKSKFDYRTNCLYCAEKICERITDKDGRETIKPLKINTDKNDKDSISFVKSETRFNESIKYQVEGRLDEWACEVRGRVESVSCLRAEEAVYHRRCFRGFTENRKRPNDNDEENDSKKTRMSMTGTDETKNAAFFKTVEYLEEHRDDYLTLQSFQEKMKEYTQTPYTTKWIRHKLIQHYGNEIVIANMKGCEDVIYFQETSNSLLYKFYQREREKDDNIEKRRIIALAADLIRNDIAEIDCNRNEYFSVGELNETNMLSYVPASLQFMLKRMLPRKANPKDIKLAAIGQAIIQLCRPNSVLCPLQLVIGEEIHHKSGSEFLVELLHVFGFSASIKQVRAFEKSLCFYDVLETSSLDEETTPLYSADNADVLQTTIDGKNTLHMMGIIKSSLSQGEFTKLPVKKIIPSLEDLLKRRVPIQYIKKINKEDVKVTLGSIAELPVIEQENLAAKFDTIRICASLLKPVPEWSGFMRLLTKCNQFVGKYNVEFLPFVDLDPNDMSTIYTTLVFIINDCKIQGIEPVVTFDQPLWLKSMMIKSKEELSITILLGNFHTQMSFLGSVGYVMKNSGIKQLVSTAYSEKSTIKILEGKQYERAMRAHDLLSTVLKKIMLLQLTGTNDQTQSLSALYGRCTENITTTEVAKQDENLLSIENHIAEVSQKLAESDTNKLWLVYIEMIDILHMNLMAERSSNWELYLCSLKNMLPYLAGTGHFNYTKSVYWFLQEMTTLKPNILREFQRGLFVVRRTDNFWSGVSPDLCIEQTLMASLKGSCGLTRGRSLSELSRLIWVLSRPGVLAIDLKLREMTKVRFKTSEQHIDLKHSRPSRLDRNEKDMNSMQKFCESRYLLHLDALTKTDSSLKNIATGLVAPPNVNVSNTKECGYKILDEMVGKSPLSFSFKRTMQAVQIPQGGQAASKEVNVAIDPDLLFQRLLSVCSEDDMQSAFGYELSHYPMSLFKEDGFMRPSGKSELGKLITDEYKYDDVVPNITGPSWQRIVDGGMLLYKIPWLVGSTFSAILDAYVKHVDGYGEKACVIFDGYTNSNTKDHCHRLRNPIQSMNIDFTSEMKLDCPKELFLSNSQNKQRFVNLLAVWLENAGHTVIQANDDADKIIVDTAMDIVTSKDVCVHADDTDILVLLLSQNITSIQCSLYLNQEKSSRIINIKSLIQCIPYLKLTYILVAHSLSGCDTTSGFFGIGKCKLFKSSILEDNPQLSSIFLNVDSSPSDIIKAGETIIMKLYSTKKMKVSTLDELRSVIYRNKLHSKTTKTKVDPRRLPPTSSAASFHSLRAFHQIQEWKGNALDALKYGFVQESGRLEPITFKGSIAPQEILRTILCKCLKLDCKSGNCSCHAFRLKCTDVCECGINCENHAMGVLEDEDEEGDDAEEDLVF